MYGKNVLMNLFLPGKKSIKFKEKKHLNKIYNNNSKFPKMSKNIKKKAKLIMN